MMEPEKKTGRELLLEKSMAALGWAEVVAALEVRASSEPGKRAFRELALLTNLAACELALTETDEMVKLFERGDPMPAAPIVEIAPLVKTARAQGALDPLDLVKIMDLLANAAALSGYFRPHPEAARLSEWAMRLDEVKPLRRALERSIDRDGSVLDSASAALGSLRSRHRILKDRIHRRLSELVARDPDSILQDNFYTQRSQRYVLPVKAEAKSRVQGIVHDASGSGQTVFVEPQELVEPNNQLKLTEAEIEAEIQRVLFELSKVVKESADALLIDQEVISHLDVVRARARLAIDLKATRPKLNDRGEVLLKKARHPLIALSGHPVIDNDLELGREFQALLVSGPNTGGKTVGLTLLGLFALMVRAGLFIPAAPDSEMAVFKEVFAVIGDEQDLSRDLSSFSAHLQDIIGIHGFAGSGSLILLDELMSPTDPEEGAALAAVFLTSLRDRGARVLVTTHLPALKSFAHRQRGFMNASFSFDPRTLSPNYKLVIGVPGRSLGIDMALRLGLDKDLVRKARSEIDLSKQRMESLVTELYERLSAIEKEKRLLESETEKASTLVREYENLRKKAIEHERELRLKSKTQVRSVVSGIEQELDAIMKPIRAQSGKVSREEALSAREKVRKLSEQVTGGLAEDGGAEMPDWGKLKKGDKVQVLPLMVEAELLETPRMATAAADRIKVRIGKLTVMVEAEKIRVAVKTEEPIDILKRPIKKKKERQKDGRAGADTRAPRVTVSKADADSSGPIMPQSMRNTLDLRGLRYNEAEAQVEEFLDRSCREKIANVFIIHGHGTGALKQMVRELLAQSPYVESFRPGEKGEGGDGATVAILKELGY